MITSRLYVFVFVFLIFCTHVSHGVTVTDLSSEQLKDMYGYWTGAEWICTTNRVLLFEDPAGIKSVAYTSLYGVATTFNTITQSSTKSIVSISLNLVSIQTQFQLSVTNGNDIVSNVLVDYVCTEPPTDLNIELLHDDSLQYSPSFFVSTPFIIFRVDNMEDKPGLRFIINDLTGTYASGATYFGNKTFVLSFSFSSSNTQNYLNDIQLRFSMHTTTYKTLTLASPFKSTYLNTALAGSAAMYPSPVSYYPEGAIIGQYIMSDNRRVVSFYVDSSNFLNYAPFVQGNFTNPTYFKKVFFPATTATSIDYSNLVEPVVVNTINFQYTDPYTRPSASTGPYGLMEAENLGYFRYPTNSVFKTDVVTSQAASILNPYPYGFTNGNSQDYMRSVDLFIDIKHIEIVKYDDSLVGFNMPTSSTNYDTKEPKVESIVSYYQILDSPWTVIKLRITDDLSGFNTFSLGDYTNIVSGDLLDGEYEFMVLQSGALIQLLSSSITITDQVSNSGYLNLNNYVNVDLQKYPFNNLNISILTDIRFEKNDIDVTNKAVDNAMLLYTSVVDPNYHPGFMVYDIGNVIQPEYMKSYVGSWNDSCACYYIPFTVPMNSPTGPFDYLIMTPLGLDSSTLSFQYKYMFGADAELRVYSQQADLLGPIIPGVIIDNNIVTVPDGVNKTISWKLNVDDKYNGLKYGVISIVSSLDLVRYNFTITPDQIVRGDMYNGDYQLNISVQGKCKSQTFYIQYAYLEDRAGRFSEYTEGGPKSMIVGSSAEYINPFYTYLNITDTSSINVVCQNSLTDTTPPVLSSFTFAPDFIDPMSSGEFFNNSRLVKFQFETTDDNGLLLASVPRIYLHDQRFNVIYRESKFLSSTATTATYECLFDIPYGFGFKSGIRVSIYGIVDNQSNFNGYSITQLADASFKNAIQVEQSLTFNVTIRSIKEVYGNGGHITLLGKNFDSRDSLLMNFNNGTITKLETSEFNANSVIVFNNPNEIWVNNVTLTIEKFGAVSYSNSYTVPIINPTPAPPEQSSSSSSSSSISSSSNETPAPNKPHTCIDNCGGIDHGVCTDNGCVCKSPWIGLYCSSQVIVIDPVINATTPSTNITVPTNDKNTAIYYAIISVVALNELDKDKQLVKQHQFPQWIVNNNTISKYSQYTNSSYLYSSSFDYNNITTNINVSIDYFNVDIPVNITFASQIFTMNPYSLKYSVNISEYSFGSSLNTLQLVLLASIETDDNKDECSSKQFGDTVESDSEYIKMQVNDHSLYGRFIKRGVVDGRIKTISNVQLDNQYNSISTQSQIQSYIGINIPFYKKSVQLDPDFSVLVDNRPASDDDENSICKKKSKLSTAQLAGIIIGAVGFAAIAVVSVSYFIYKRRQQIRFEKSISMKVAQSQG